MKQLRPHPKFPRSQAAVAGLGYTEFSRDSGVSTFALAARAVKAAIDDAGLKIEDIDGLATYGVNDSIAPNYLAQALGIQSLGYFVDQWGGGNVSQSIIGQAALAVSSGVADCVVCYRALNARSEYRMGGTGRAPVPIWDAQFKTPGHNVPAQEIAMSARSHMLRYGTRSEDFGRVAVLCRENAIANERAMKREPLTLDDYMESRWVVEPFRLLDCCLETDGAVALVVVPADRAKDLRHPPAYIRGAAWGGGYSLVNNGYTEFPPSPGTILAKRVYDAAGLGPDDIEFAELYDCFTYSLLVQLEDFGFAEKGGVPGMLADGVFDRASGRLPVNTNGGLLSEGYIHGLNNTCEAVQQIRGEAGERQVAHNDVGLVTGNGAGFVMAYSCALVLTGAL
jgi:acetyl-CoA acetyltransferase